MDDDQYLARVRRVFPNAYIDSTSGREAPSAWGEGRTPTGRGRSPRLDLWTHKRPLGTPHLELNIANCGQGFTETAVVIRDADYRPKRGGLKRLDDDGQPLTRKSMSEHNLERAVRRAKRRIRQSSLVLGADRMLSLTSRKYLADPKLFWRVFGIFNRKMTREYGDRWRYVCCPELHPKHKDHWHAHLAIRGNYPVERVRYLWRESLRRGIPEAGLDHSPGNIDIAYRPGKHLQHVKAIAKYIAKYLSKDLWSGDFNAKRYEKSRGLDPDRLQIYAPLGLTDLDIIRKVQELSGGALSGLPRWGIYGGFDVFMIETEPVSV